MRYSGNCARSTHCFGSCGLVGAKNCILNTSYSKSEYHVLEAKIIEHMKSSGEWGKFFPANFAPNPYDESWSATYWPLSKNDQISEGFHYQESIEQPHEKHVSPDMIPDSIDQIDDSSLKNIYWDEKSRRPFQILTADINICKRFGIAPPDMYYTRRVRENFAWMPFDGELRTTTCAKSGATIQTSWPTEYDGRILSEDEYLKIVG